MSYLRRPQRSIIPARAAPVRTDRFRVGARRGRGRLGLGADTAGLFSTSSRCGTQVYNPGGYTPEYWRPLVERYAGDIPVDFLMAWIMWESCGDPCSFTKNGESGIFQLMPPDNMNQAGVTQGQLRAACSGASQTPARPLTSDEETLQVTSGIKYVNWARAKAHAYLDAANVTWDETTPDFWSVVKQVFNAPTYIPAWLANATATLGYPPTSWDEFIANCGSTYDFTNATTVGTYGAGGGGGLFSGSIAGVPTSTVLLTAILATGAYLLLT